LLCSKARADRASRRGRKSILRTLRPCTASDHSVNSNPINFKIRFQTRPCKEQGASGLVKSAQTFYPHLYLHSPHIRKIGNRRPKSRESSDINWDLDARRLRAQRQHKSSMTSQARERGPSTFNFNVSLACNPESQVFFIHISPKRRNVCSTRSISHYATRTPGP
jgi:hypothetical protein